MRKLMLKYLDEAYPNIYYKKTKFGNCLYPHLLSFKEIFDTLSLLFSCSPHMARSVIDEWKNKLPVYESILNSTNEEVLIRIN